MAKNTPPNPAPRRPAKPLLEIFRVGRHRAMDGSEISFGTADLRASAAAYDPAIHEAPIVIGHPRLDAPAYGWIGGLQYAGDRLEAEPRQVATEFADMVREGRFKKISSSFYAPSHPANPVPGVYYLKHVGFLGAVPPSIKGMRDPEFADDDPNVVTFEFGEDSDRLVADVFRRFREWLIETQSVDVADRIVPSWTIDELQADAIRETETENAMPEAISPAGFSEPQPGDSSMPQANDLAEREAKLNAERAKLDAEQAAFAEKQSAAEAEAAKLAEFAEQQRALAAKEADIAARETALREKEEAARIADIEQFADGLCRKEGRLLLKDKPGVVAFLSSLPATGSEIEFADGDETVKQMPAEWFRGFLSRLPVQVDFSEFAPADGSEEPVAQFAVPSDASVSRKGLDLHNKALTYQKQHPGTTYLDAAIAVGG